MYKVLLLTTGNGKLMFRQTRQGEGVAGNCRFYINEPVEKPDFLVVRGKGITRTMTFDVPRSRTLLLTSEPYSVLAYPEGYCRQFGTVCSCQPNLQLPNVRYTPAMLPWFVGMAFGQGASTVRLNYEDLATPTPPTKTKLLSVISSTKAFTQGHIDRLRFVEKLRQRYGDQIDVFGRGYRDFADKWDVLAPYKYHIAIENSSTPYYWTEKLSDCYLTYTYPIYYGCTNIHDYFPEASLATIDIHHFEQAVEVIDRVIAQKTFEQRQDTLAQCKEWVMGRYNLFDYVAAICEEMPADDNPGQRTTFRPTSHFFNAHNLYLQTVGRNWFKMKNWWAAKTLTPDEAWSRK
jgi:hypothetical protein